MSANATVIACLVTIPTLIGIGLWWIYRVDPEDHDDWWK